MENSIYLFAMLLSSFIPAVLIFLLAEKRVVLRNSLNLIGVFLKLSLVFFILFSFNEGMAFHFEYQIASGIFFILKVDALSLLFAILSSLLWLVTTIYAIGYLRHDTNQKRFFGFLSWSVTATIGLSIAGNLFTFFIFYELLTLMTVPLIFHKQNEESRLATVSYLKYTIFGGLVFLLGIVLLEHYAGLGEFASGGYLSMIEGLNSTYLQIIFLILFLGVGVKAAIFPLHGWLAKAMAAPAPVSALLHAVAVVKAGAFGVVRIVYEVYGVEFSASLGLLWLVMVFACVTIIYGSIKALFQTDLKKRLAYSTISQVSYILLGVSIFGPLGTIGGLVHLVHQGVMKITLFFCAGGFSETYGIKKIEQMDGLGKLMPLSSISFSIAALGMIGIPPIAGFVSKWYLGLGALENGLWFIVLVLALSTLLNSAYFLPLLYRIWFKEPAHQKRLCKATQGFESNILLILPPLATAIASLILGVFALQYWGALSWVELLIKMEYKR